MILCLRSDCECTTDGGDILKFYIYDNQRLEPEF